MIISEGDGDIKQKIQEIIVENACQEYTENVQQSLSAVNKHLDEVLVGSYADLEDLEEKIAARTNYLEKNPEFLSTLNYTAQNIKIEALREFDEIKITLKEHSRRIYEKIEEIEGYHKKLYELVIKNSKENLHWMKNLEEIEDEIFEDCLNDAEKSQLMKILEEEEEETDRENPERRKEKDLIKEPENTKSTTSPNQQLKITESEVLGESGNQESSDQNCESEDMEEPEDSPTSSPQCKESNETLKSELASTEEPPKTQEPPPEQSLSFDTVTIRKNAFSEISLHNKLGENLPDDFQLFPDVVPEVQRRKPVEDIHLKLIQQVTASDSLEGFIKLMERKPTGEKVSKNDELVDKYAGSLWFFAEKKMKKKSSKNSLSRRSSSPKICKKEAPNSCNILMTNTSSPSSPNQDKMRKTRSNLGGKNKLKYYDLLDDVNRKDLKPIKSEYPRRDNIYPGTMQIKHAKSYLHWMLDENEHVWKKLLQPTITKKRKKQPLKKKKGSKASIASSDDKMKKRSVKSLNSSTTTVKNGKNKNVQSLLEYLTSPEQKFLHNRPQTLIVMPVKVSYDNFPTKEPVIPPPTLDLLPSPNIEKKVFFKWKSPRSDPGAKKPEDKLFSPLKKKQQMLEQLKGLKLHNNNIQNNIQKAIDVIEAKIIDLLSSPSPSGDGNADAFNAMEEEISKVLKMVKENEVKNKTVEKIEPEKDDRHHQTELRKEKQIGDTLKKYIEETPNLKLKKPGKTVKNIDDVRRAANIEEGERLLGQVDSVIKKIDSIYHKFYDENKCKQPKAALNNEVCFFNDLKITGHENVTAKFQEAKSYELKQHYHKVKKESPRKKKQEEEIRKTEEPKAKIVRRKKSQKIKQPEEPTKEVENQKKDETNTKQVEEIKTKEEVIQVEETTDEVKVAEEMQLMESPMKKKQEEEIRKTAEPKAKILQRKKSQKMKQPEKPTKEMETKVENEKKDEINTKQVEVIKTKEDVIQVDEKTDEVRVAEEMQLMEEIIKIEEDGMKKIEHLVQEEKPVEAKTEENVKTEEVNLRQSFLKNLKEEINDRHDSTLKLFYAIYFSSLFFLLNFDYAAL